MGRPLVVVALNGEADRPVTASDPVDDEVALANIAVRHPVGDDVADGIGGCRLDDDEVTVLVGRQHRAAADDDVQRGAAERLWAKDSDPHREGCRQEPETGEAAGVPRTCQW